MIGQLIGSFVAILIAIALFPVIQAEISSIGVTGMSKTLLALIPFMFALGIIAIGFASAYNGLNDAMDSGVYEEDYNSIQEPHKQTYEEYVAERLRVEKMMRYGPILGRIIP
jgi:hypothetical protein